MREIKVILHAEDDAAEALFMERALRRNGIGSLLFRVEDGRRAIGYLSGTGPFADRGLFPLPDLIFLDVKMPKVSGFEVLRWIRNELKEKAPLVAMLTASNQAVDRERAQGLGVDAYILKPPSVAHIRDLSRRLGLKWPPGMHLPESGRR